MKIGITGGIGSGKSTVTDYIIKRGYQVFDADKIAHEIEEPGGGVLLKLASVFGPEILAEDGSLDRKTMAAVVFSDDKKRKILNDITHREIHAIITEGLSHPETDPVFTDVPLLFESGFNKELDRVWLVTASEETRVKRVVARDGGTPEEVRARIRSQMSDEEKEKMADAVISNDCALEELYEKVDRLLDEANGKINK